MGGDEEGVTGAGGGDVEEGALLPEGVCHFGVGKSAETEALREEDANDSVHPAPNRAPHRSDGGLRRLHRAVDRWIQIPRLLQNSRELGRHGCCSPTCS